MESCGHCAIDHPEALIIIYTQLAVRPRDMPGAGRLDQVQWNHAPGHCAIDHPEALIIIYTQLAVRPRDMPGASRLDQVQWNHAPGHCAIDHPEALIIIYTQLASYRSYIGFTAINIQFPFQFTLAIGHCTIHITACM